MLLLGLQAVEGANRGFQFTVGAATGDRSADLGFLYAFASLGHVHLLAQAFDSCFGFVDVLAHVFRVGAELGSLFLLDIQLIGQGRNGFGHFHRQVFAVGLDRGHGLGLQVLDLGVVLADAISRQFVLGHDGDQLATGVGQGAIGFADFLVEDAQGLLIDDGFADFGGAAAQCGEQLAPDGLCHVGIPFLMIT
ncbi:hypothetical protein D3C71_750450 [compost metagenome]